MAASASTPRVLVGVPDDVLPTLSVRELKQLLATNGVDSSMCLEKSELVALAIAAKSRAQETMEPALVPYLGNPAAKEHIDYYAVLEVPRDAPIQAITRSYYKLAREYHPDKNPNNPFAEAKFKQISEAYTILSDPEKRAKYDQYGMDGVTEDFVDPRQLFRMLFGGGRFEDIFGDVSFCDLDLSEGVGPDGMPTGVDPQINQKEYERKQEERKKKLAHRLLIKLEPHAQGDPNFTKVIEAEAKELAEVPGGAELLVLVGFVYMQEAKQHMDTFFGIPAFFSNVAEKGHMIKETIATAAHVVKMQQAQSRMDKYGDANPNKDADMQILMQEGLKTIWRLGKLEINTTIRAVCEQVLEERITKKERKARCKALKMVGEIFSRVGKQMEKSSNANPFIAFEPSPTPRENIPHK